MTDPCTQNSMYEIIFFYDKCCIWPIVYCLPIWFVSFLNVFSSLHAGEWEYFRTGAKVLCKLINLVYKGGATFSLVIEMYSVVIVLCQYLI